VELQPATRTAAASAVHFMRVKVQPAARALNVGTARPRAHAGRRLPISQWCPDGSAIRPIRHP
jgi:hypothetical protein